MKLYVWDSDGLADYRPGYIIVIAPSIEDARRKARAAIEAEYKQREISANRSRLKFPNYAADKLRSDCLNDVEKEPTIQETGCILIWGSS